MDWRRYALSVVIFSTLSIFAVYVILRLQGHLPLNPQGFLGVKPDLAFNTAASFTTNTNWQSYAPESTMSYLSQMLALTVQNFVSAAVGIVVVDRAHPRLRPAKHLEPGQLLGGPYALHPLDPPAAGGGAGVGAGVARGDPELQRLQRDHDAGRREAGSGHGAGGVAGRDQAARDERRRLLQRQLRHRRSRTRRRSRTSWRRSRSFSFPAALTYTFGKMVGSTKQGWAIFAAMAIIFLAGAFFTYGAEQTGNPVLSDLGVDQSYHTGQQASSAGGNLEGKEVRFGIADSAIWAAATTDASNGSVNSMHDSYTPLGGLVPLFNIQLGEVVFGGVGSGLYGMLVFAIIAVFVAGLMIGRTPEYLGKKIGPYEMKMAAVYFLVSSAAILLGTAIASVAPEGKAGPLNAGPHGFSEILYAFSSAGGNNGSAFAGITTNTAFYNTSMGIMMLVARFLPMLAVLALAGSLVRKQKVPESAATLPTNGPLFAGLVAGVVIVVGGLTFFPALALGPMVEHFLMQAGVLF